MTALQDREMERLSDLLAQGTLNNAREIARLLGIELGEQGDAIPKTESLRSFLGLFGQITNAWFERQFARARDFVPRYLFGCSEGSSFAKPISRSRCFSHSRVSSRFCSVSRCAVYCASNGLVVTVSWGIGWSLFKHEHPEKLTFRYWGNSADRQETKPCMTRYLDEKRHGVRASLAKGRSDQGYGGFGPAFLVAKH